MRLSLFTKPVFAKRKCFPFPLKQIYRKRNRPGPLIRYHLHQTGSFPIALVKGGYQCQCLRIGLALEIPSIKGVFHPLTSVKNNTYFSTQVSDLFMEYGNYFTIKNCSS